MISFRIGRKLWKLEFVKDIEKLRGHALDGRAEVCDPAANKIQILRRLRGRRKLEVIIHELLHACDWQATERSVEETAHHISRVLWALGYRDDRR